MVERDMSERERRELANRHRGEVVPDSGTPVEGRRLAQVVSLRFEPEILATLRDIANRRGMTVSDLLREGADVIIAADRRAVDVTGLSMLRVTVTPARTTTHLGAFTANPSAGMSPRPATA
jgi:predicted DNA-binding ribbon-helix-helix protein